MQSTDLGKRCKLTVSTGSLCTFAVVLSYNNLNANETDKGLQDIFKQDLFEYDQPQHDTRRNQSRSQSYNLGWTGNLLLIGNTWRDQKKGKPHTESSMHSNWWFINGQGAQNRAGRCPSGRKISDENASSFKIMISLRTITEDTGNPSNQSKLEENKSRNTKRGEIQFWLDDNVARVFSSVFQRPCPQTPEEFENGDFTLKTHLMFSVHGERRNVKTEVFLYKVSNVFGAS